MKIFSHLGAIHCSCILLYHFLCATVYEVFHISSFVRANCALNTTPSSRQPLESSTQANYLGISCEVLHGGQ